jgi:hypothetical protein
LKSIGRSELIKVYCVVAVATLSPQDFMFGRESYLVGFDSAL